MVPQWERCNLCLNFCSKRILLNSWEHNVAQTFRPVRVAAAVFVLATKEISWLQNLESSIIWTSCKQFQRHLHILHLHKLSNFRVIRSILVQIIPVHWKLLVWRVSGLDSSYPSIGTLLPWSLFEIRSSFLQTYHISNFCQMQGLSAIGWSGCDGPVAVGPRPAEPDQCNHTEIRPILLCGPQPDQPLWTSPAASGFHLHAVCQK